jgi:ribonuclease VapC
LIARRATPFDLVVDTSAVMAIVNAKQSRHMIAGALAEAEGPTIAAPTRLELSIVAEARLGRGGADDALAILDTSRTVTFPFDEHLADLAFDAWMRFGKGRHRAALNFGDCFSYALAVHLDVPLLCVGDDFAQTDAKVIDVTSQ